MQGDLDRFREDFRLIGRHLTNASGSYGQAEKRLERFTERLAVVDQRVAEVDGGQAALELPAKPQLKAPQ
jgi:DNA anti-recombination protein RmuC